jgi:hypothetical protein
MTILITSVTRDSFVQSSLMRCQAKGSSIVVVMSTDSALRLVTLCQLLLYTLDMLIMNLMTNSLSPAITSPTNLGSVNTDFSQD